MRHCWILRVALLLSAACSIAVGQTTGSDIADASATMQGEQQSLYSWEKRRFVSSVQFEWWVSYPHSYAVVNVNTLLHLAPFLVSAEEAPRVNMTAAAYDAYDCVHGQRFCHSLLAKAAEPRPYMRHWTKVNTSDLAGNVSAPVWKREVLAKLTRSAVTGSRGLVLRSSFPYNIRLPSDGAPVVLFLTWERQTIEQTSLDGGTVKDLIRAMRLNRIVVVTPSQWSAKAFEPYDVMHKVHVVPHGINPQIFHPTDGVYGRLRWSISKDPSAVVIGSVGAMTMNKNIQVLLHAFLLLALENDHLFLFLKGLAGLYPSEQLVHTALGNLMKLAHENGSGGLYAPLRRVFNGTDGGMGTHFNGRILIADGSMTADEMGELYRSLDLYAAPYSAEAFCLPVLEAMASGLPVIVPRGGPTDEFTYSMSTVYINTTLRKATDQSGSFLEVTVSSMVDALQEAIEQLKPLRSAAIAIAETVARRYSWSATTQQFTHVLTTVLEARREVPVAEARTGPASIVNPVDLCDDDEGTLFPEYSKRAATGSDAPDAVHRSWGVQSNAPPSLPPPENAPTEQHEDVAEVRLCDDESEQRIPPEQRSFAHALSQSLLRNRPSPTPLNSMVASHLEKRKQVLLHAISSVAVPAESQEAQGLAEEYLSIQATLDMIRAFHNQQHPDVAECRTKRLLVISFRVGRFDGVGALLRSVVLGLTEAAYENRTLIWGHTMPPLWERASPEWTDAEEMHNRYGLNCSGASSHGGGPYNCLFESLSSCNLQNSLTETDVVELRENAYNHSARIKSYLSPIAVCTGYFPIPFRFQTIVAPAVVASALRLLVEHDPIRGMCTPAPPNPRHRWFAAATAYTFRVKSDVVELFEAYAREALHWNTSDVATRTRVWTMHARNGDVANLRFAYGDRDPRDVAALTNLLLLRHTPAPPAKDDDVQSSSPASSTSPVNAWPHLIFVASDASDLDEQIQAAIKLLPGTTAVEQEYRQSLRWAHFGSNLQYRAIHGSHHVAADGACADGICALPTDLVQSYRSNTSHGLKPQAKRLMRVLLESVRDIHLLSLGERFAGVAQSSYSTIAAGVLLARNGAHRHDVVLYADEADVEEGILYNSFFDFGGYNVSGPLGPRVRTVKSRARDRWDYVTHSFRGHLPELPIHEADRFTWKNALPVVPLPLFLERIEHWTRLADPHRDQSKDLDCPGVDEPEDASFASAADDIQYASLLTNHGVNYSQRYFDQARRCWIRAVNVLRQWLPCELDSATCNQIEQVLDVAVENQIATASLEYVSAPWPFNRALLKAYLLRSFSKEVVESFPIPPDIRKRMDTTDRA